MALAEEKSVPEAWKKILIKPAGKSWSDVVVAVKTNQIADQRTRGPVMGKLCRVLTDVMGVKPSNVVVYDATHGGGISKEGIFTDLPDGVVLGDKWGGYNLETTVPEPYFDGTRTGRCLDHLVKGDVDILVNICLCKGHNGQFGAFTGAQKNHFGTYSPRPAHARGGGADFLIGINRSAPILGDLDPRTGSVLFPRQQLVLVDALWASQPGPGGLTTAQPNTLLMGTACGPVDYIMGMRLRKDAWGWPVNEQVTQRFLSDYGFRPEDLPNGGQLIDAMKMTA
jgi:hypothetical protein